MGKARDSITGKQEIWGGEARKEPLRNLLSRCLLIETLCWIANLEPGWGGGGWKDSKAGRALALHVASLVRALTSDMVSWAL